MKVAPSARVAFQGERGAFSEEAAVKLLGEEISLVPRPTFEAAFNAIADGAADYILAPIENSLAGPVHRSFDLLVDSKLSILAEVIIPIVHNLIVAPGARFEEINVVESHPVALAQCEHFFSAHPRLRRIATEDTAGSVRDVVRSGDRDPARAPRGQSRELHALPPALGVGGVRRKRGQAFARFSARSPAGRAVSLARALRAAKSEPDEDRKPARTRPALAVPILFGLAGVAARSGSCRGAARIGRLGRRSADSRVVCFRAAVR
jgi:hypothetical protein